MGLCKWVGLQLGFAEAHLDRAVVLTRFTAHLHALVHGKPLQPSLVPDDRALRDERV